MRAVNIYSNRIDRALGLTLPQLIVLECVRKLRNDTCRELARCAALSPPTVVGVLDKLERKGLIERHRSQSDRRIVHVSLTDKGAEALDHAPPPLGHRFARAYHQMSPDERAQTLVALERLAALALLDEDDVAQLEMRRPAPDGD
ncbi:MAG: MarR family winged helix-turn-helix transcriptional regulator [Hyphomicrobiaceae bacterium]